MSIVTRRQEMKRQIKNMERKESQLEEALAQAIARRENLDDDLTSDRAKRDRLKERKENDQVYDRQLLAKLNTEIRETRQELVAQRQKIEQRRTWLQRQRRRLKRARRRFRNVFFRPKIIDLNLSFRAMAPQTRVNRVIGHYTAGPQDRDTDDAIRLCRIYHQAHLNNGWSGEGYMLNFTVDGDILLLRPAKYVGAHTLGYNTGSYGIMMHGTTGDTATFQQKRALRWWGKHGHEAIMRSGQTSVRPDRLQWYGHNDFNPTSCPGSFKNTYRQKGYA